MNETNERWSMGHKGGNARESLTGGWWRGIGHLCLVLAAAIASPAQDEPPSLDVVTFKTLVNFDGTNGANPGAMSLVQGADGAIYGTTELAGTSPDTHEGNVFKITAPGTLVTVHYFNSIDGAFPAAGVVLASNGNFYGTTQSGGAFHDGTIFKMTPAGALSSLYSFNFSAAPSAPLVETVGRNFYGTTMAGGPSGCGTILIINPAGIVTTLHDFNSTDGCNPGPLIQGTTGNLLGTTALGGAHNGGTVFRITPGGTLTILHSFHGADGENPNGLIQAIDGNFYGTTYSGGSGDGTIFRINPDGMLSTVLTFDKTVGSPTGLVQATDGNFYGTTTVGGANGFGAVFKCTPTGALSILHSFNQIDGVYPEGALLQATDGSFYGSTNQGGTGLFGTVFRLSVGLGPFVKTLPTSGRVGGAVQILGTNLTGATSVSLNGTPAVFQVVSHSLVRATVPAGATTGFVTVTTPAGTLTSNLKFQVRQ